MNRRAWAIVAALLLEQASIARAQPVDGEGAVTGDPVAAASPARAAVSVDLPDVPARPPDRFGVMLFTNESSAKAMDWAVAAVPFELGEKVAQVFPLEPAYGPLVVPDGPAVSADPTVVAAYAKAVDARWVFTGWLQRPGNDLKLGVILWLVDGGVARPLGLEVIKRGPQPDLHKLIAEAVIELATRAGWLVPVGGAEILARDPARELYAIQMLGKGLGNLVGATGPADRKQAERDFARALLVDPKLAWAHRLVGELDRTDPDPKIQARAIGKFSYAADLAPDYAPALRAVADAALAGRKPDQARDLYERLVRVRPWDLELRLRLGDARWQAGDAAGATRELDRVIARTPDDLRARRILALIHAAQGDVKALAAELEQIVLRAPNDLDTRADLGAAYVSLGRLAEATAAYEIVSNARPTDGTAAKRVGDVYRLRKDVPQAVAWYARASRIDPQDPRPFFLTGAVWLEAGNLDEAHKAYVRAESFKEYLGQTYMALAAIAYRKGTLSEASWYLRRAVKARPWSRDARASYALVLCALGDWVGAAAQTDIAVATWPEDPQLWYLRGVALGVVAATGDPSDVAAARTAIGRAIALAPADEAPRRADARIRAHQAPSVEGALAIEQPFGDSAAFQRAIDRFFVAGAKMTTLRATFGSQVLTALGALAQGPYRDLSAGAGVTATQKARAAARAKGCPVMAVARPWQAAADSLVAYQRAGVDLEEAYRVVVDLDNRGETVALTPDYRARVGLVRTQWRLAVGDVRDMRTELSAQLGRELRASGCREDVLTAAANRPLIEQVDRDDGPEAGDPAPVPVPPAQATFYVDNRSCLDPVAVWVDGEQVGDAPGGQRAALSAPVGRRTLCLLPPGSGSCGDQGTVREIYLADGWSVTLHCLERKLP
ncbi:MAG: tetratricopeptide repeat protein [Deltaproteobacteria bacterium]|nr:tetratricopeptide repeat protein [Deltaproteobacteria bacterium]